MPNKANWITRIFRLLTKDEVKTPLAFLFKVVPYLIAALVVILYAPIGEDLKLFLVKLTFFSLLGISSVVMLFAWCRPKHLVYGETGHRAEYKLEYGNETKQISKEDIEVLQNVSNPDQPRLEQD